MGNIIKFFDSLDDKIRAYLSRHLILFGFIAGTGVVLFWRGVWHSADTIVTLYTTYMPDIGIDWAGVVWWDGPLSIAIGSIILLTCGAFVSEFIGKEIIISGLKGEKTLEQKTEREILTEGLEIQKILKEVKEIKSRLK